MLRDEVVYYFGCLQVQRKRCQFCHAFLDAEEVNKVIVLHIYFGKYINRFSVMVSLIRCSLHTAPPWGSTGLAPTEMEKMKCCLCNKPLTPATQCVIISEYNVASEVCEKCMIAYLREPIEYRMMTWDEALAQAKRAKRYGNEYIQPDEFQDLVDDAVDIRHRYNKEIWCEKYSNYLESPIWKKLRAKALKRDNHICQDCGERATQVHHRTYATLYTDDEFDDLVSLCRDCHRTRHGRRGRD